MRARWLALGVELLSALHIVPLGSVHAGTPNVNVGLRASFYAAPYLVELLETAAEENSTAYLPLLDRIAEGVFRSATTDEQLYSRFLKVLQSDGHITDPETLSSFKFALSIHSAAPRIEAHYQFYETSVVPSIVAEEGKNCENWVASKGRQHCTPDFYETMGELKKSKDHQLPFDRFLGDESYPITTILYTDLVSPGFANFHKILSTTAKEGKMSYRIRYKPSRARKSPLAVSGYGVELALKKTDYIVIDDRQKDEMGSEPTKEASDGSLKDEEITDIKPLSTSELSVLGMNAASFVMNSQEPLDTLLKLSQDFPKHSTALAARNASDAFVAEQIGNAQTMPPTVRNVLWINGLQIESRQVNAFSLLEHLRRERTLINNIRALGLSGPEAIGLLSHDAISDAQSGDETQRYDWRDQLEGGDVIMWMNDIEKDKRYLDWPSSLDALLQRTFPGQLPPVRREIHNVILPVDFSNSEHVQVVVDMVQSLIRRKVPIRWGLVPVIGTPGAAEQAQVAYHLLRTFGLATLMSHFMNCVNHKKLDRAHQDIFDLSTGDQEPRQDQQRMALQEVLGHESKDAKIDAARAYLARLGADGPSPPIFVNGVPVPNDDEWLQVMSNRVSVDLRSVQRAVYEELMPDDSWVPSMFLVEASTTRNPLIIPDDQKSIKVVDLSKVWHEHGALLSDLPLTPTAEGADKIEWAHMIVVGNFDGVSGMKLFQETAEFLGKHTGIETIFLHNGSPDQEQSRLSTALYKWAQEKQSSSLQDAIAAALEESDSDSIPKATAFWKSREVLLEKFGLKRGEAGVIFNGRVVGPIPQAKNFALPDFKTLLSYESRKRVKPVQKAFQDLGLMEKVSSPLVAGKLYSLVATSTISDVPEGIFESLPLMRISTFNTWNSSHTVLEKGDKTSAIFQVVAAVDPVSEAAQRWIPILKVLSELDSVYLKIFLNPKRTLSELPVKRFYRYVMGSSPSFAPDGKVKGAGAEFTSMPAEALLTMGMDVPPSWLVAPRDSVHDLDNIKLSSVKALDAIEATYELEHILIEGHSRDTKTSVPPRGAQLRLGTESDPHFADTIIMANLGYFQFKANPGFYRIALLEGRSDEIFQIDSAGTKGYSPTPGDETADIALTSFMGLTLFPRISRRPGKEDEDVLRPAVSAAEELASVGTHVADQILAKVGLGSVKAADLLSEGSRLLGSLASKAGLSGVGGGTEVARARRHADVNIFSVASGHLYERMLNIMMVSVMKHTNHTVKFWFVEQFLSPSFRASVPLLAAEYGFAYELVTYKWPHWLRAQREKQREIWGYKILFLDVLFPLDLDRVLFVDADQVVRTDMHELAALDLGGAPYAFTPMCDSRAEMEGFRFWKQGFWKNFLQGLPYHISALYAVDLARFRALAAGDRLRGHYQQLSADPASLANLDQDLPNSMQAQLPIFSLPGEWLWCETWCADADLARAKTIDLCNNPMTKEPKLDRARRQLPEWTAYDDEVAEVIRRRNGGGGDGGGPGREEVAAGEGGETPSVKDEL